MLQSSGWESCYEANLQQERATPFTRFLHVDRSGHCRSCYPGTRSPIRVGYSAGCGWNTYASGRSHCRGPMCYLHREAPSAGSTSLLELRGCASFVLGSHVPMVSRFLRQSIHCRHSAVEIGVVQFD